MDNFGYERREIGKALSDPYCETFRLKVEGNDGASRWLNVTREQVEKIREAAFPAVSD